MSWLSNTDLWTTLRDETQEARARIVATHFGHYCPHLDIPHFVGVFSADNLPPHASGKRMLIVNSDPQKEPGEHWLAYYQSPTRTEFFDSMGQPTWKYPEIEEWLRQAPYRPVYTNKYRLQGPNGLCGSYCYYYLKRRPHVATCETLFFPDEGPPFVTLSPGDDQFYSKQDLQAYLQLNDARVFNYLKQDLLMLLNKF